MRFSSLRRFSYVTAMEQQKYDLLVIGGGITGAGIALDAATRGMKVALIDMQDFAAGTSSRSTKLIHGGLRYLKQLDVKLVAEVGRERAIVYENGPHVTKPEWMLLPIYENSNLGIMSLSIGLRIYDYLAHVMYAERRKMLKKEEVLRKEPLLRKDGLLGAGYYVEYRTDDARLTIEVIKQAVKYGVHALNYAKMEDFLFDQGKVIGTKLIDQITGREAMVYAKKIINATGPWVEDILQHELHSLEMGRGFVDYQTQKGEGQFKRLGHRNMQITKGVHLVFDGADFPLQHAIYFIHKDKRMIFAIPRDGKTYVGTTDTIYDGKLLCPKVAATDYNYLLEAIHFAFPSLNIGEEHIESSWAGLRPLIKEEGKRPSEISRRDEIWLSSSGLISIAGGKLTGYRKMAEETVNLIVKLFKEERYKCFPEHSFTRKIAISGGEVGGASGFASFVKEKTALGIKLGLFPSLAEFLVRFYGSNVDIVFSVIEEGLDDEAHRLGLPIWLYAQIKYAIEHEMTMKPIDFFVRRTGALYFNMKAVLEWKGSVVEWMAGYMGWTKEEKANYVLELEQAIEEARAPSTRA